MSLDIEKIGDVCTVGDGAHASIKRTLNGIPYYTSKNFKIEGIDLSKVDYISEEDFKKHFRSNSNAITKPIKDDILLSIIGSIGAPHLVKDEDEFGLSSSVSILRPKVSKIEPKFLYYWIKSDDFQNAVHQIKSGVAQSFLSLSMIKQLPVIYPKSLETQKRIASILSTYDNLIENNLKRIKLLEETAQNIYKEWFVNFRFPNYEHTDFDAESGLPVGWEKNKLEEVAKLIHGYAFDAKRFTEEPTTVMVLRMGNFKEKGGLQLDKNVKYISKEYDFNEKFKLFAGDLIIVLSDVTRDGRIIGNVGILPDYGIEYALNQRVAKLECENKIKTYLYCALNSFDFKEHCKPRANGATVLNLKSIDVNEYKIILPPESIIESFSAIINPLLKIMENLDLQNQKLKEVRDILLPRLMNRTIEV